MSVSAHCHTCGQVRQFTHLRDTAHGLPGTHMVGSERFECASCGECIRAEDNDGQFHFQLDGREKIDG